MLWVLDRGRRMLRKCSRCQNAFQPETQEQAHCKPCLRHFMPWQTEQTVPAEPTKLTPKGKTIGQILQSSQERAGAKEVLGNL